MMVRCQFLMLAVLALLLPIADALSLTGDQSAIALTHPHPTSKSLMAQGSPEELPPEEPDGAPEPPWIKDINLTTEQKNRIQAIHEKTQNAAKNLHQQLRQALEQERSLMAGNATAEQIQQQHQQVQRLFQQLDDQRFEAMLSIREILTPDQRAQVATLMKQHRGPSPHRPPQP
ncbi:Spy/CpxP family protein refolding chaperone [Kovacikia minuta CCNUW1]|uniref:Spy/CpxP family protein refolding chaperone n=1 Tax=Kovacikia minuta TaxID=2931930 RepID=UPI001CCAB8C4|nr:Spy/CpxP family protein refolding chaperone [Kovacikia minuta]UBF25031.1 Spy/CpxP family protein refolding chaperone [Kovacikia minuta CCNUW1]